MTAIRIVRPRPVTAMVLLALAPLVLQASGCAAPEAEAPAREIPRNVRVMELAPMAITEYFEAAGPVQPVRGTDVSAEESGTVADIVHDKGDRVAADDVLVALDRRLLAADLASAEAALKLRAYDHEQTRQLYEAGKISRLEFLQSESQYEQARAQRDQARVRHDRAAIKAPFAGLVTQRYVEPGQLVAPGLPVARVIDPYTLKIEAALTETEVAWIAPGQSAAVKLEGADGPVAGTVGWVGFEADPRTGKFDVEIHVPNPDLAVRPGTIGRVRLTKRETTDAIVIPRDAVLPGKAGDHVYVVAGDRAALRTVSLGPDQGLMVTVREGLESGELLVVRGQRELQDGSLVEITETVAAGDGTTPADPDVIKATAADTRVEADR